jgi:hypothetical protein
MRPTHAPHGPDPRGGPGRASVGTRGEPGPSGTATRGSGATRPVAAAVAVAAVVTWLGVTDPYRPGAHLACPVLALTGLWCAACGGQRAVHELAHGDVVAAWGMNPLVVLAAPLAVVLWARWLRRATGRTAARTARATPHVLLAWTLLAVVAAFTVLRNVPALHPWLAP